MFCLRLLLLSLIVISPLLYGDEMPTAADKMNYLASRYEKAQGFKRNYAKAFRLYCISAALGNVEANYNLGWMRFNGRGFAPNKALAIGWFERAANLGDAFSLNMLNRHKDSQGIRDKECPILPNSQKLNKKQIEAWVRIIASSQEIDPALVLAVIRAESAFQVKAHSNKNARGLMQLIPKTAQRFGVDNSWNPIENILGGITYLHWLIHYFKGDVKLVLAAYNAGEEAVSQYKGVPPYRETQQYVKKIMAHYKKHTHSIPPA